MLNLDQIESFEYVNIETVYDLEIEENHNYFLDVGEEMLVHNSSKTFSILQLFIYLTIGSIGACISSVVSESIPHLKLGCIRDFKFLMGDSFCEKDFSQTDNIYNFGEGKLLEFFSADNPGKVHGPRRNNLFINEVNNVPKSVQSALSIRTQGLEVYDYNPTGEFYLMEEIGRPGVEFIKSTYLDAKQYLPISIVDKIEARRDRDPNWWNVYGLGNVGNVVEGLVHPIFSTCDEMPSANNGVEFYGLDFGFTEPTALIRCIVIKDQLYCDQLIYETGLTNPQIATRMESLGIRKNSDEIFADSAEPKSIKEIASFGFNIKPAEKGSDSVRAGTLKVNEYRQFWTKRSVDAIKEQRNYRYIQKGDGKITEKPMDDFNHAMDARRYGVISKHLKDLDRVNRLVHFEKVSTQEPPIDGDYEVINGFAVAENKATAITCQWDKSANRLHVNFEATMDTIEKIVEYINSVKKSRNIGPSQMNETNGAAVKNVVSALMEKKVALEIDQTYDVLGSLFFLNSCIDRRKFSVNPQAKHLLLSMQNDVEIKGISSHLEALLYIVNNVYVQVKTEDTRKPIKPFTKDKTKYQEEQEVLIKGKQSPDKKDFAEGWR